MAKEEEEDVQGDEFGGVLCVCGKSLS